VGFSGEAAVVGWAGAGEEKPSPTEERSKEVRWVGRLGHAWSRYLSPTLLGRGKVVGRNVEW